MAARTLRTARSIPMPACLQLTFMLAWIMTAFQALALDPARHLSQLHHTAWTLEDGAPPDVWALAQSRDGYLWLGTGSGLFRFDGVRFEKFQAAAGEQMPSLNVNALYADESGDIWIGFVSGDISRLHDGHLTNFKSGLPGAPVNQIVQDKNKVIWAALAGLDHGGGLVRFSDGKWQIVGKESGFSGGSTTSILPAKDGALWVASDTALFVLRPGTNRFEAVKEPLLGGNRILQAPNGRIWLSSGSRPGLRPVPVGPGNAGTDQGERLDPPVAPESASNHVIVDRDGTFWGTYQVGGVFRIVHPSTEAGNVPPVEALAEKLTLSDGLSSNIARPLLEDREGNIWVGTNLGLDRFRLTSVVAAPGIPATSRHGYFIARGEGGSVYVASSDMLFHAYPERSADIVAQLTAIPTFLAADRMSTIWLGLRDGLDRLANGQLWHVALPAEAHGIVGSWIQDDAATTCVSVLRNGVFCGRDGAWTKRALVVDAAHPAPTQLAYDSVGGIWLNYDDRLARFDQGEMHVFSAEDGLSIGGIDVVAPGTDDLLVGGEFGVARFDGLRFASLRSEQSPALSRITGIVETAHGDVWLNGIMGVVHVDRQDLLAAFTHPDQPLRTEIFDLRDGLPGVAQQDSHTQTALEASDGRLWFVTSHGIAWIDPRHLAHNAIPPPVSIRSVMANGREYLYPANLSLPKGTANIQIDYTALSLSIPERVRFRYRLDGVDTDWVDPGTRREAFYTKLEPGRYQFHLIAANNDGVWNTAGTTLTFVVPPTFMQSIWFKTILGLALCSGLWILYSVRLRQVSARMRGRLEERLAERERIARELHDTLLQGFQGLVLRFQAAAEQINPAHPARDAMETALDSADEILEEGRNRVFDLRTQAITEISQAFADIARRLLAGSTVDFSVIVEGRVRALHPVVQEEITRIGQEALANAVRHARPEAIEVLIAYSAHYIRLSVRDNGIGIEPGILKDGGRQHHFGMIGMRERALKVRGSFAIKSRPGAGTEIILSVPASVAYVQTGHRGLIRAQRKRLFEAR